MSRKDQIKLLLVHLLLDDPFIKFARETKTPLAGWAYINAIKLWRDRLNSLLIARANRHIDKVRLTVKNKAIHVFDRLNSEEIDFADFLNFLLALAEDIIFEIRTRAKNRTELPIMEKLTENLFKLYQVFDPEIDCHNSQIWGEMAAKMVREVF